MTRYGYLGPEGTFTSMALDAWAAAAQGERAAYGSVDAALAASVLEAQGYGVVVTPVLE